MRNAMLAAVVSGALCVACAAKAPPCPPQNPQPVATPVVEASVEPDAKTSESTVVIFVRHAEKASDGTDDPPLTAKGQQRAQCLADMLQPFAPDHLLSSPYQRTQATLAPLAERITKPVTLIDASDADAWNDALRSLPAGSRAVVSGHSNTIPKWIGAFGANVPEVDERGNIPHDEYDWLVTLVLDSQGQRVASYTVEYCTDPPTP